MSPRPDERAPEAGDGAPTPQLSPELEAALEQVVDSLHRRRKRTLYGYLTALVIIVGGTLVGLGWMGQAPPGEFRGWVLLVPVMAAAAVLWAFGRWARQK